MLRLQLCKLVNVTEGALSVLLNDIQMHVFNSNVSHSPIQLKDLITPMRAGIEHSQTDFFLRCWFYKLVLENAFVPHNCFQRKA